MKPESGRVYASLSPSLSRASSIDRSIASRCLRSRRARRALPSSLVRDNPIPSRAIHSSRGRAAPSSPASIASTAPRARRSTYIHKHQLIDQTKKNNHGTHAQQKIKTKNRTGGTIPARASASRPRARAASTRRSIARESSSRARETSTRPRDSRASLECDAFGRSVGRSSRSMDEGDGGRARMDARRARTARAMRTRAKRKSRCEGMKTGERDGGRDRGTRARRVRRSFGDDSRRASTRSND